MRNSSSPFACLTSEITSGVAVANNRITVAFGTIEVLSSETRGSQGEIHDPTYLYNEPHQKQGMKSGLLSQAI